MELLTCRKIIIFCIFSLYFCARTRNYYVRSLLCINVSYVCIQLNALMNIPLFESNLKCLFGKNVSYCVTLKKLSHILFAIVLSKY